MNLHRFEVRTQEETGRAGVRSVREGAVQVPQGGETSPAKAVDPASPEGRIAERRRRIVAAYDQQPFGAD